MPQPQSTPTLNLCRSGKGPSGRYIYEDCMVGGWKDWYADASWMR